MKQFVLYFSIPFFFLLLWSSCGRFNDSSSTMTDGVIRIDLTNYRDHVIDTAIVESYDYIPLSNDVPMGQVDKLLVTDDQIVVFDKRQSKAVYSFDLSGKLTYILEKRGKGPGEFLFPTDVDLDPEGNIYVLDVGVSKIIKYYEGKMLYEEPLEFRPTSFAWLSKEGYTFYMTRSDNDGKFHFASILWDRLKHNHQFYFPFGERNQNKLMPITPGLYRSGSSILFSPFLSEKVYRVSNLNSEPQLIFEFDFGKYSYATLSDEMKKYYGDMSNYGELLEKPIFRRIDNVYETSSKIVCSLDIARESYLFVYSKTTGKYLLKSLTSFYTNDGILPEALPYAVKNDTFFSVVPTSYIISYLGNWRKEGRNLSELEEKKVLFLNSEDYVRMANPVISHYKLKDF